MTAPCVFFVVVFENIRSWLGLWYVCVCVCNVYFECCVYVWCESYQVKVMKTSETSMKTQIKKTLVIFSVLNKKFRRHRGRNAILFVEMFAMFFFRILRNVATHIVHSLFLSFYTVCMSARLSLSFHSILICYISIVSKCTICFLQCKQTELNTKYRANRNSFHNHIH